ncbi:hypothetical protein ABZ078_27575 [Streptomyces sp. NPDC006385]|uniref:hypothetical protein n=1 Tax=Streptomyces sp. NPDC006385 TaxID=3156761 RepID=UPI0033B19B96
MNFIPQVETAEISDAALDQVAGGQAGGSASAGLTGTLTSGLSESVSAVACADVFAAVSPEGVAVGVHAHGAAARH